HRQEPPRDAVPRRLDLAERDRPVVERSGDRVGGDDGRVPEDLADHEHRTSLARSRADPPVRARPDLVFHKGCQEAVRVRKPCDELTDLFGERGFRVTPQRQVIFRLLEGDDAHPTVESIYDRARAEMPTMSMRTVYQTVHDLAALGEVDVLDLGTG